MNDSAYLPSIGIETHVQLKTKTKLFSAVGNDARDAAPNSLICHIDAGLPGALPVLNQEAVKLAVRMALALKTQPEKFCRFDRKHYFYPDLPKGYQISQYEQPIIAGGRVSLSVDGQDKSVGIVRAHLEEDAGKNTHPAGADYSLVDLNRAGTPLLEIVSQPDMHSPAEAKAYARELYLLAKFAGVTGGDLYQGNIRFDLNVSVSSEHGRLGIRSEVKNLNSFRSVENAAAYEIKRQIELLKKGQPVVQETRGWDEAKQKTTSQRGKEEAEDYRYMPEPDIPPIEIDDKMVAQIREEMPRLPQDWREILNKLSIPVDLAEQLIEGEVELDNLSILPLINSCINKPELAKFMANWIVQVELPLQRENAAKKNPPESDRARLYAELFELSENGQVSSNGVVEILKNIISGGEVPADIAGFAAEHGFKQMSDEGQLGKIIDEVLAANQKVVDDIKAGNQKAVSFLVGRIMAESQGQANPQLAARLLRDRLGLN